MLIKDLLLKSVFRHKKKEFKVINIRFLQKRIIYQTITILLHEMRWVDLVFNLLQQLYTFSSGE